MIRTGYRLAPCDATVCFVNGILDVVEYQENGDRDRSVDEQVVPVPDSESSIVNRQSETPGLFFFSRAIELNGRFFAEAAKVYLSRLDRPDLAVALAGNEIGFLNQVATMLSESDAHTALADQARAKVAELLEQKAAAPDAAAGTLASLAAVYAKDGKTAEAIDLYRRALTLDYGNIGWRLNLARLLAQSGDSETALHEAKIILRLKPGYAPAKRIIEEASVKSQ